MIVLNEVEYICSVIAIKFTATQFRQLEIRIAAKTLENIGSHIKRTLGNEYCDEQ